MHSPEVGYRANSGAPTSQSAHPNLTHSVTTWRQFAAVHLTLPALAFGGPGQCADWDDLRVIAHQRCWASTSGLTTLIGEPAA
jgi:hypothetical protein